MTSIFDGKRFTAVEPMSGKTLIDVLKWRFGSTRAKWPRRMDHGPFAKPSARVEGKKLQATFVNHSTVLLQTRSLNILTDPVWSERVSPLSFMGPKRVNPPGITWNDLPKIDVVLISHSHYDHLDMATVKKLVKRDDPLFIVPLGVEKVIHKHLPKAKVQVIDWRAQTKVSDEVTVTAVPAQHWSARGFRDRNQTLWCGFIVHTPEGNTYYAGDTGYASGKIFREVGERYGPIRFAILPIGAYEPRWFMHESHANPEDAVKIFQDVRAERAMAVHWGTFQLTDEAIDAPVAALDEALKKAGIPLERFRALKPGENWIVD